MVEGRRRFYYEARAAGEDLVRGEMEAATWSEAARILAAAGKIPSVIRPIDGSGLGDETARHLRAPRARTAVFTRQTADLIAAGFSVLRAVSLAGRQVGDPRLRRVADLITADIGGGEPLSASVRRFTRVFPSWFASLVRSGEMIGDLPAVLRQAAAMMERDAESVRRIRAGLVYPGFLLAAGAVTVTVLLTAVLPRLAGVLEDVSGDLPGPTRILLGLGRGIRRWGPAGLILLTGLGWGLRRRLRTEAVVLRVPVLGRILRDGEWARTAGVLGVLLGQGVDLIDALTAVREGASGEDLRRRWNAVIERVRSGSGLAEALRADGSFPEDFVGVAAVGERSGAPGPGLLSVAEMYERRLRERMETAARLVEPGLILILGGMVAGIVAAVLLPILRWDGGMGV